MNAGIHEGELEAFTAMLRYLGRWIPACAGMTFLVQSIISQNPLFFAFFFPAVIDGIVTLVGQHKDYWTKGYKKINEASPAYYVLRASPWLFILGSILWFVCWYKILSILPQPYNLFITIVFIAGHAWGSNSWIWKMMKERNFYTPENQLSVMRAWVVNVLYFCIIAATATYCIEMYFS